MLMGYFWGDVTLGKIKVVIPDQGEMTSEIPWEQDKLFMGVNLQKIQVIPDQKKMASVSMMTESVYFSY